jgi:YidC/Oxa1 family membrane protein insertase
MKVLRPEINELGRNSKKDPMKQQETMKLYNKAGVNQWPVASGLLQMPVFYALFQFSLQQ